MESVCTDVMCLICRKLEDHDDYVNFCLVSRKIYLKIKNRVDKRPVIVTKKCKSANLQINYVRWRGKFTRGTISEFSSYQTIYFKDDEISTVLVGSDVENEGVFVVNNFFGYRADPNPRWKIEISRGTSVDGTPFVIRECNMTDLYKRLSEESVKITIGNIPKHHRELPPYVFQGIGDWPKDKYLLYPESYFLTKQKLSGICIPDRYLNDVILEIEYLKKITQRLMCPEYSEYFPEIGRTRKESFWNVLTSKIYQYFSKFFPRNLF
jgi:hypothetical protein